MRTSVFTLWVILLTAGWQAFAHAPTDGDIHAVTGPLLMRTLPIQHGFDSPYLGGGGLIAEGDIDYNGGIEIGLFFFNQLYSLESNGQTVSEIDLRTYITMGYRHWATHWLSGALSFYSSYSMGEAQTVRNDFGLHAAPPTSAEDMTKYGLDFSIQVEPWHYDRWSAIVDARYSLSLTAHTGEDANFYAVLVGVKYFVQGSHP